MSTERDADLAQFLASAESCVFPTSSIGPGPANRLTFASLPLPRHLSLIAQEHRGSAETLAQLSWGLVLQKYLCTNSVCFGYLPPDQTNIGDRDPSIVEPVSLENLDVVCAVLDPLSSLSVALSGWHKQIISRRFAPREWSAVGKDLVINTALAIGNGMFAAGRPRQSTTAEVWPLSPWLPLLLAELFTLTQLFP